MVIFFFGWSTWMEQDGYAQVNPLHLTLRMEVEPALSGKILGSFVSVDTYLVIPEGVYHRSMNPEEQPMAAICGWTVIKDVASVEQSLNTLISNTSHIKMDTYHAQLQSANFASSMMKLGCYLLWLL